MNDKLSAIKKQLKSGLIKWYDFPEGSSVFFSDDSDALNLSSAQQYDYIVVTDGMERVANVAQILNDITDAIKDDGVCLLAFNNRLGIRYFCGDTSPDNMYSKSEIKNLLEVAGFKKIKFYSVFADLDNPTHIFAEGYTPKEDLANRVFPAYNTPETVFIKEEELYRDIIDNGIFHSMANAFLVEVSKSDSASFSDVLQVTSTLDREPENAFLTIVHENNRVIKKNACVEGKERFENMIVYADDLRSHGIEVIDMRITPEGLSMPYIAAPTTQLVLKETLLHDRKKFLKLMDDFRDCIMKSSEVIGQDRELGPIVRYGYVDMVPLNSFYNNGKFLFFDQEFRVENYPVNVVVFRMIASFYFGNDDLAQILKPEELFARYGLLENRGRLSDLEMNFLVPLTNEKELSAYHARIRRNNELTARNHEKMRMSADKYLEKYRNDSPKGNKPYHIGYVAGAFDMFHIGHLNLLRRAKERCDYLVAGVISDERVYELKKRNPVIPCNERMQVVAGCRYVDEVIELPLGGASIRDAYERVHFDCMFSGDDHANDPGWLMEQEYLRSLGSDIVFVSYTKETSSTDIRKKISQRNLDLKTEKNYKWIYTYDYAPESRWEPWRDEVYKDSGENVDNRERKSTPAWITKEAEDVVSRLKEYVPAYILLADSHFTYNGTWEDTFASMKAVSERTKIKGIIHLGDMTDGLLPLNKTTDIEKACIEDMKSLGTELYLVPGNHDYNYFKGNPEIKYPETPQYYIDNNEQKIRLIFIDSFDPKEEVRYGFTKECISWLDKTLEALPDDYNAIIFSHLTPLVRLQAWTKDIRNRNDLIAVLDKYADRILAFINGHNHCDHIFNDLKNGKFPIISINCSKCEYFTEHKPAGAVVPERRLGDRTQESFDIMQIDPDKKEIYFTRFGAGQDRIIKGGKGYFI